MRADGSDLAANSIDLGDLVLSVGVVLAALLAVGPRSRRVQVTGFLSLGVVLSIIWLRLGSIDVAFAEAALGTGLLSALLVQLAAHQPSAEGGNDPETPRRNRPWLTALFSVLVGALLATGLVAAFARTQQRLPTWTAELADALPDTGVEHGVTGVLLAFRGYDTLLESAVLLFAGVVILSLGRGGEPAPSRPAHNGLPSILGFYARLAAPVLLLAGGWLLFAGSTGPGGAFQSGAIFAALLILLHLANVDMRVLTRKWLRPLLVVGVIVFVILGALGPLGGEAWLSWHPDWAFVAILTVEIFLTAGITAGLYLLYLGLENPGDRIRREVAS